MTKRNGIIIILLGIALGVQSCGGNGTRTKTSEGDEDLGGADSSMTLGSAYGIEWRLTGFEETPMRTVALTPIPDDQTFTLTFADERTVTGMAHCKGYSYSYEVEADGTIRFFDPGPQIGMHCGDDSRDAEFYQGMQSAYAYELTEKTLRIRYGAKGKDGSQTTLLFTRDEGSGAGKAIELVEFALYDPAPSDPFTVAASRIVGDELRLTVQYGGGCAEHDFSLIGPLTIEEGNPTPVTLYLHHNANDDRCKAYLTTEITFDLTPLRKRWMEVTGRSTGTMALSIGDLHTGTVTAVDYVVASSE